MKKLIIIFLLLFCVSLSANTPRTGADLETQIREIIKDDSSNSADYIWTSAQILKKINFVIQEINMLTWCEQSTYNTTISSYPDVFFSTTTEGPTYLHSREIYLPSDIYVINRVLIENEVIEEKSIAGLDKKDETWNIPFTTGSISATGEPDSYYIVETSSNSKKIGFDPPPDKTYRIDIDYVKIPDDITSTTVPWSGKYRLTPYQNLIVYRVASMLIQERNPTLSTYYLNLYDFLLKDMQSNINLRPNYSGSSFNVQR